MCALSASSQTVVAYLGYLLDSDTISTKSIHLYLNASNTVHNDFEYPPPVCGHLVKLAHKGSPELQGSSILQPQEVRAFPVEHMLIIVQHPHLKCPQLQPAQMRWKMLRPLTTILCRGSKIQV